MTPPRHPDDEDTGPASIYDVETPQEDLWFMPDGAAGDAFDMPWETAPRAPATEPQAWARAEAQRGRALARAAAALARLDEALAHMPEALPRLALEAASDLAWATGTRIAADRLALYDTMRLTRAGDDAQAFARAHWAFRRLSGGPVGWRDAAGLTAFFGRHRVEEDGLDGLGPHAVGEEFERPAEALGRLGAVDLHPLTLAGLVFATGRALEIALPLELAVLAARIGAAELRTLPFLPLGRAVDAQGDALDRLTAWYAGVTAEADTVRHRLRRLADWRREATEATADLSGRTPALLIAALLEVPALSAEMAAERTGASRPGIRRNMALLEERGLVKEITGHDRFRFWRAMAGS